LGIMERIKRFFFPKEEHREEKEELERFKRELAELDRKLAELKKLKKQKPLVPRRPVRKHQPASQTYTAKKIRGLPPRSAYKKRLWRTRVSKEELENA